MAAAQVDGVFKGHVDLWPRIPSAFMSRDATGNPSGVIHLSSSPHVALLPGDDVKHGGHQEEGAQAHTVHPGGDPLPTGVRQAMQQRHADEGRHNEELQPWKERDKTKKKKQ